MSFGNVNSIETGSLASLNQLGLGVRPISSILSENKGEVMPKEMREPTIQESVEDALDAFRDQMDAFYNGSTDLEEVMQSFHILEEKVHFLSKHFLFRTNSI